MPKIYLEPQIFWNDLVGNGLEKIDAIQNLCQPFTRERGNATGASVYDLDALHLTRVRHGDLFS
jgi:hypothetical protein